MQRSETSNLVANESAMIAQWRIWLLQIPWPDVVALLRSQFGAGFRVVPFTPSVEHRNGGVCLKSPYFFLVMSQRWLQSKHSRIIARVKVLIGSKIAHRQFRPKHLLGTHDGRFAGQ